MNTLAGCRVAGMGIYTQIFLILFLFCGLTGCGKKERLFAEASTSKSTTQVLEDAEFAITERNFRINNRLHIGKAISERGSSGFPDYEVILFCNLSHAQKMLELAPEFISYCPHRVTVRDTGDSRVITASLLPQATRNEKLNAFASEINALVIQIIEFAAKEWSELEAEPDNSHYSKVQN